MKVDFKMVVLKLPFRSQLINFIKKSCIMLNASNEGIYVEF